MLLVVDISKNPVVGASVNIVLFVVSISKNCDVGSRY